MRAENKKTKKYNLNHLIRYISPKHFSPNFKLKFKNPIDKENFNILIDFLFQFCDTQRNPYLKKLVLKRLISNLIVHGEIAYFRSHSKIYKIYDFKTKALYSISAKSLINSIIDPLIQQNIFETVKGFHNRTNDPRKKSFCSSLLLSQRFRKKIFKTVIDEQIEIAGIDTLDTESFIRIKNKDKTEIILPVKKSIQKQVDRINALYKKHKITVDTQYKISGITNFSISFAPVLYTRSNIALFTQEFEIPVSLHRVFNDENYETGGRFYGFHQNIKREYRTSLKINDNETVEIDYSGLHINMLYHMENIDYQDDPYYAIIPLPEYRPFLKKLLLVMINAKSFESARRAIQKYVNENSDVIYPETILIKDLIQYVAEVHNPISKYFCSSIGIKLQNIDSDITLQILNYFTENNIVCLPVHDSFIVEKKHELLLKSQMQNAYQSKLGFTINLTQKGEKQ
jgi:hypothetical protein